MSAALQELVVYALVIAAAGWLIIRWRSKRARACSNCAPARPTGGVRPRSLKVLP
ncbi:MAG TPA: hypothetical protein VG755_40880 [Nannocystaceae bacterium]|nr:hypothetical protein [Nannocystaceae bacterium]